MRHITLPSHFSPAKNQIPAVHTDFDKLVNYHVWQNEAQMMPLFDSASKAAGKPITTLCAIVDMGGMSTKLSTSSASALARPGAHLPRKRNSPLTPTPPPHTITPPSPPPPPPSP